LSWMIYGANGYTGKLTAKLAVSRGERPVLAGRNEKAVRTLGESLGLDYRVFSLEDPLSVRAGLEGIGAVLHQAGPFSATSRPMVEACLEVGAHYLDITGEISVFRGVMKQHEKAVKRGIVLMPGVGFDVVPTDCVAAMLKEKMPDATHLELAIHGSGGVSPGTTKTAIEGLPYGSAIRREGKIETIGSADLARFIPFHRRQRHAVAIPWGDLETAWHSTQIPNITTYMALPPSTLKWLRRIDRSRWLTKQRAFQWAARKVVDWRIKGPDEQTRETARCEVWGEVTDARGRRKSMWLEGPEGYSLTADASLRATLAVLGGAVESGARTPSMGLGANFVAQLDGVEFGSDDE